MQICCHYKTIYQQQHYTLFAYYCWQTTEISVGWSARQPKRVATINKPSLQLNNCEWLRWITKLTVYLEVMVRISTTNSSKKYIGCSWLAQGRYDRLSLFLTVYYWSGLHSRFVASSFILICYRQEEQTQQYQRTSQHRYYFYTVHCGIFTSCAGFVRFLLVNLHPITSRAIRVGTKPAKTQTIPSINSMIQILRFLYIKRTQS